LVEALKKWNSDDTWLDGESSCCAKTAAPASGAAERLEEGKDARIVYFVFDAPFLDGLDLRSAPLSERGTG